MPKRIVSKRIVSLTVSILLALSFAVPPETAFAQKGHPLRLIRDTEIENTIRTYAKPVLVYAGLDPENVHIYIVQDPSLNSFVAGGQNIFINTGLLIRAQNASQIIGVLAHETGHIAHGDLARTGEALRNAQAESIVAMVLGAAAAVLARRGEAGVAILGAGQNVALRSFLSYTRVQEAAADQFAVTALDATGQSSRGMLQFFSILENEELLVTARRDPYLLTHPLTAERIAFVRNHVAHSRFSNVPLSPRYVEMQKRMQAKLIGFLWPPQRVFQRYKESDNSLPSRYARAIAYHRLAELDKALATIDSLIREHPKDPYFHELKGQILFESGKTARALAPYRKAVALMPQAPLLRADLARVMLELNEPKLVRSAMINLKESTRRDPYNASTWRLLAIAYGRQGRQGMAALALAEEAVILGQKPQARLMAKRAKKLLKKGSPPWRRADDIVRLNPGGEDREAG